MPLNLNSALFVGASQPRTDSSADNFYQALVNTIGVGFIAADAKGMIILANCIAYESFGIQSGGDLSKDFPELWSKMTQKLTGRVHSTEISLRRKKNNYLIKLSPILVGTESVGSVCVFVESDGLEEMAKQMSFFQGLIRELEAVINESSEGLWICDGEANVLRLNPAAERIHNISAVEVIGQNMRELVAEGFIDKSATLEVMRTGKAVNLLQQRHGRKLVISGKPVFDAEGEMIRVVSSVRDITEIETLQRELEEQELMKGRLRNHMLELQQMELEARRVVARSPCMLKALRQAVKVSAVESTVLILGESGVGKGLLADMIHKNSQRSEKPLIKINCGAIPESLIESELFGYEKGAFTGAHSGGKPGYLELADGGTLFLDEIAELPLPSQVKLLRFLEDGRITRLGVTKSRNVDVRILAATHRNLEEMVSQEKFRLDLYYRLKVIPIEVPSVRDRKECILPLIQHYMEYFGARNSIKKSLTRAATDALLSYTYPGNVRELMNICERLVVMTETDLIDLKDLPSDIVACTDLASAAEFAVWPEEMTLQQTLDSLEREVLVKAMRRYSNQRSMAVALGVNQSTIARKLNKYGFS